MFALALLHGLFSGTDSSAAWAFWMYAGTGVSVLVMTAYRMLARHEAPKRPASRAAVS